MVRSLLSLISAITLCAVLPAPSAAKTVAVSGCAPGYAGRVLVMRAERDPVSRMTYDLASAEVKPDGSFRFEADIKEVTHAFIDLSFYEAHLFLEPGGRYKASLPRFRLRPDAERFNPFYRPKVIDLTLNSATSDLNQSLRKFDDDFGRIYLTQAVVMCRKRDKKLADSVIERLDSAARATGCRAAFFRQHVEFRKAEVYATPRLHSPRAVLRKFYAGKPVAFNVPAYWRTLDLFGSELAQRCAGGSRLAAALTDGNPDGAREMARMIEADSLFRTSPSLGEVLTLKSIRDNFYEGKVADGRADTLLISAARDFTTKRIRLMAANVYASKNKLKAGLPAPDFDLVDNHDREFSLASFKGRFLYLCFMHSENYECVKAMPVLDNLAQVHRADLDILCVFTDDEADALYAKLTKSQHAWRGISWIAWQRILEDYEVRGLPTYFLIDPDGCISIAQAPGPSENVGPAIAECVRRYRLIRQRGRVEVPRTIYDIANGGN